jgi:predicted ribosome quality control (RQC) complex YloA/Tae2 family protein
VAVEAVEDCAYQDLSDEIDLPLLDSLKDKLDTVTQEQQAAYLQEREAQEVKRMIETLERAGYKLVKA